MTQTPRPTPPPPPIIGAVYLPTPAPLPADPTPAARRWCADVAEAESLGHAALVLRYAHALSALRAVWRSRSRRIAAAAPRVITDPAELDALSVESVVLDANGDAWQRDVAGWQCAGGGLHESFLQLLAELGPLTLIHVPAKDACPHDSRSGTTDGRWRCDECGADCGPDTYLTEEDGRG